MDWNPLPDVERGALHRECRDVVDGLARHRHELECTGAVANAVRLLLPRIERLGAGYAAHCNAAPELPAATSAYVRYVLATVTAGFALALVLGPLREALDALVTWERPSPLFAGLGEDAEELAIWHRRAAAELSVNSTTTAATPTGIGPATAPLAWFEIEPRRQGRPAKFWLCTPDGREEYKAGPAEGDALTLFAQGQHFVAHHRSTIDRWVTKWNAAGVSVELNREAGGRYTLAATSAQLARLAPR